MKLVASWSAKVAGPALLAVILGSTCLHSAPVHAQTPPVTDAAEITLKKRVYKSGEINHYKMMMKTPLGDQSLELSMTFKETTKNSKPTGEFVLQTEFEVATANIGGNEQDIVSLLPVVTLSRNKDGKVTSKLDGGNEQVNAQISTMMEQFASMGEAYLPTKPVKIGDKWKVSASTPNPTGGESKTEGESTLVGTEIVNGVKSYKIKVSGEINNKQLDVKGHTDTTLNLDPDSGKLLKISTKVDGTMNGNKVVQELELHIVPADTKAAGKPDKP